MTDKENVISDYFITTSPLSDIANKPPLKLKNFKNEIDNKIRLLTSKTKSYFPAPKNTTQDYSEMKAKSIIYNVPEFSTPEVNFQVSDKVRQKVHQIKEDIIGKLPVIKSRNYNTHKFDVHFNHRTMIKELQQWLRQKLKNPPVNYEESIEYKNMIMGMGMKEVIRIINTRCVEEGNMVNQVWELTWSICREIMIYLAKRTKKCEDILDEEMAFIKDHYEKNIETLQKQNMEFKEKHEILNERSTKLTKDIVKIKKKNKQLRINKLHIQHQNQDLRQQYLKLLNDNMKLSLEQGSHKQREWVKKMHKNLSFMKGKQKDLFSSYVDKIMKENSNIFNLQENYEDLQIQNDYNSYMDEEKERKDKIAYDIANNFKMSTVSTQTQKAIFLQTSINTDIKDYEDLGIGTEMVEFAEMGTVTKSTVIVATNKRVNDHKSAGKTLKLPNRDKEKNKKKSQNSARKSTQGPIAEENVTSRTKKEEKKVTIETKTSTQRQTKDAQIQCNMDGAYSKSSYQGAPLKRAFTLRQDKSLRLSSDNELSKSNENSNNASNITNGFFYSKKEKTQQSKKELFSNEPREKELENLITQMKSEKEELIRYYEKQLSKNKEELMEQAQLLLLSEDSHNQLSRQSMKRFMMVSPEDRKKSIKKNYVMSQEEFKGRIKTQNTHNNMKSSKHISRRNSKQHRRININDSRNEQDKEYAFSQLNGHTNSRRESINLQNQNIKFSSKKININPTYNRQFPQQSSKFLNIQENEQQKQQESSFKINTSQLNYSQIVFDNINSKYQLNNENPNAPNNHTHSYNKDNQIIQQIKELNKIVLSVEDTKYTQKYSRTTLQKNMLPVLKELHLSMKKNMDKLHQLKNSYSSLSSIVANRFNRNFGVKKVAYKHLKNLLYSLKYINKYSKRYNIISYFMLEGFQEQADIQLLFLYILLTSLLDPSLAGQKMLSFSDIQVIKALSSQYLTSHQPLYQNITKLEYMFDGKIPYDNQVPNTFIDVFRNIIIQYKTLKKETIKEYSFLYEALSWVGGLTIRRFTSFIAILGQPVQWHNEVIQQLVSVVKESSNDHTHISFKSFIKFIMNSKLFTISTLKNILNDNKSNPQQEQQLNISKYKKSMKKLQTRKKLQHQFQKQQQQKEKEKWQNNRSSLEQKTQKKQKEQKEEDTQQRYKQQQQKLPQLVNLQKMADYCQLTHSIIKFMIEGGFGTQAQLVLLQRYVKYYIVQKQVQYIMGPLLAGSLNAKTSSYMLNIKHK